MSRGDHAAAETEAEREARGREIQRALAAAADVPRRTADVAAEVVGLAESVMAGANPNVVSDVAASAASARAALLVMASACRDQPRLDR